MLCLPNYCEGCCPLIHQQHDFEGNVNQSMSQYYTSKAVFWSEKIVARSIPTAEYLQMQISLNIIIEETVLRLSLLRCTVFRLPDGKENALKILKYQQ